MPHSHAPVCPLNGRAERERVTRERDTQRTQITCGLVKGKPNTRYGVWRRMLWTLESAAGSLQVRIGAASATPASCRYLRSWCCCSNQDTRNFLRGSLTNHSYLAT